MNLRSFLCLLLLLSAMPAAAQTCPSNVPRVAPDSRYDISEPDAAGHPGELVVRDVRTGLVWKRCLEGRSGTACENGAASTLDWGGALGAAGAATWAGYDDWRLPNYAELTSLLETGCYAPAVNGVAFPSTMPDGHWSASGYVQQANLGWAINFYRGDTGADFRTASKYVRLVRGGPVPAPFVIAAAAPAGHGTITPATQRAYAHGTAGFAVVADAGYHVDHVVGDACSVSDAGNGNWNAFGFSTDCSVTAAFAINVYTLSYVAGANGTLSGDTSQSVEHGSSGTPVTALPDIGYHFLDWSDGNTANPRGDGNVTGDLTATANFAMNVYTVNGVANGHGLITPATQAVHHGDSASFTVLPFSGFHLASVIGDTCSVSGAGTSYGTSGIVADCMVSATFTGHHVGGAATGLTGSGLTLQLNGGAALPVAGGAGSYQFPVELGDGAS